MDVDAPGGDIGGHQHPHLAFLELGQGLLPGGLGLVPVDGPGVDARLFQLPHHPVGAVAGAHEHQGALHLGLAQQIGQQPLFVGLVHQVQLLAHAVHGAGYRVHLHRRRLIQDVQGQLLHLGGHGGGKEQRLPPLGQRPDHLAHVVDKAHVQHPVGLVQHENLQLVQANEPLAHQVVEAARGGHQDIHPPLELLGLGQLLYPAENHAAAQVGSGPVGGKVLVDLQGQLPGRGEHQRPYGPAGAAGSAVQPLQNGQGEGGRLAGAGLGAAQHVLSRQRQGDGLFLNGGGPLIALLPHRRQQGRGQAHGFKAHAILSCRLFAAKRRPFSIAQGRDG